MKRLHTLVRFALDRLGEPSTWQGIGFIVGLYYARANNLDWGGAAALGGTISALIKAFLPDRWK